MQLSSVVLPQPEGPMMATISPRGTLSVTPRSAFTTTSSVRYVFTTSRASMIRSVPFREGVGVVSSGCVVIVTCFLKSAALRSRAALHVRDRVARYQPKMRAWNSCTHSLHVFQGIKRPQPLPPPFG